MRVALALERFDPFGGGVEAYVVGLARRLIESGWEVHLFGHSWVNDPTGAIFHHIHSLPSFFPPSLRILHFALSHRRMIQSYNFDVVVGFGNTLSMNVYQSHGGVHYFSTARKIDAIRNPFFRVMKRIFVYAAPKYYMRAWIEAAPFRLKDRPVIIAISDMVRRDLSTHFHVREEDIIRIYNGADHARFHALRDAAIHDLRRGLGFRDEVLYLFMAYDLRKKGAQYLLEAGHDLKMRVGPGRFGIVIVGGKPSWDLRSFVTRSGLAETVVFAGPTTQPELYFQACDVLVLPTFYDACSLVVFEALASGAPVITTRFNGAAGVLTEGVTGFVLDSPSDVPALTEAMEKFLDKNFLFMASQAARKDSLLYGLDENYSQMIQIFNNVAAGKRTKKTSGNNEVLTS